MTVQISLATSSDIPELCELLNVLFSQDAEFVPNHEAQSRGLARIIGSPEVGAILVARQGGKAVGMVSLLYTASTAIGSRLHCSKIWSYPPFSQIRFGF